MLFLGFGWGKPVMFDPYNLKDPKSDAALIALAGPASNLILATILAIAFRFFGSESLFASLAYLVIQTNVGLAIFNLIPIHPLDGGKILIGLAPKDVAHEWDQVLHQYGTVILLFLILPLNGQSAVSALISPIVATILRILL
jgi:Zn-dependent protease